MSESNLRVNVIITWGSGWIYYLLQNVDKICMCMLKSKTCFSNFIVHICPFFCAFIISGWYRLELKVRLLAPQLQQDTIINQVHHHHGLHHEHGLDHHHGLHHHQLQVIFETARFCEERIPSCLPTSLRCFEIMPYWWHFTHFWGQFQNIASVLFLVPWRTFSVLADFYFFPTMYVGLMTICYFWSRMLTGDLSESITV